MNETQIEKYQAGDKGFEVIGGGHPYSSSNEKWVWRPIPGGSIAVNEVGAPISNGRVATIPYKSGFEDRAKERAMLISAAPEMYWVLAEVETEIRHQYPMLARRVSAALAKARGES